MRTKTIGRNRQKKAEEIFDNAINIRSYTLDNGFVGKDCDRIGYDGQNWLLKDWRRFDFSKLTTVPNSGRYCLHVHSNCWYEFESISV